MSHPARSETAGEPLEIELLATQDQRRTSAIEKQIAFRESIAAPGRDHDEIDMAAAIEGGGK